MTGRMYQVIMKVGLKHMIETDDDAIERWKPDLKGENDPFTLKKDNNVVFKCRQADIYTIENLTALIEEAKDEEESIRIRNMLLGIGQPGRA